MTVNYTTNLALGQPVTGTESGTWGDDVNNAVTSYLDIAIAGGLAVTVTTADVTLTLTQGTSVATNIGSTTAQYAILNVSGAMTAARNLIVPSSSRQYVINNNTTGGFLLTVKGSATTGVTLVNGEKAHVFWTGTDYSKLSNTPGGAGTFSSITNTGLTSGRVVFSTTNGLETDSAGLTFDGTNFATTGTATAAKLIPTGNSATGNGLYLPAANSVGISTNGTNAVYIDSSQNVGIGTSSGSARLNVNGGTSTSQIRWEVNNAAFTNEVSTNAAANAYVYKSNDASYHVWKLSSAEAMRIDSSGNVGVGTSSPSSRVDARLAASGSGAVVTVGNVNNGQFGGFGITDGAPYPLEVWGNVIVFKTNGASYAATAEKMRLDTSGYLGIGETVPLSRIHVSGAGFGATTTIRIDSTSTSNSASPSLILTRSSSAVMSAQGIGNIYFTRLLTDASSNTAASIVATGNNSSSAPTCTINYDAITNHVWKINSTEAARIDSSGNVGIGTSSPSTYGRFAVVSAGDFAQAATFISNSSATNWARADWDNVNVAYNGIIYQDNSGLFNIRNDGANAIAFSTNGGNERMRIDSNGNVVIGSATSAGNTLRYFDVYNTDSGASAGAIIRLVTSNAAASGNTTVDLVKYKTGGFILNNNDTDAAVFTAFGVGASERMRIDSSGNVTLQNNISVGAAAPTTSGTGITFPATQSASSNANTLDDYEEGTFTPTYTGSITNPTFSYNEQVGIYTKIGNIVYFAIRLSGAATAVGSGDLRISGLPFTTASTNNPGPNTVTFSYDFVTVNFTCATLTSSVNYLIAQTNVTSNSNVLTSNLPTAAASYFTCGGFYRVA